MKILRTVICCLLLLLAPCAGQALADGVMRDGLGAISAGRGGTNLGFADNGAILSDNPAAMVNLPSCGLSEFSVDGLFTDLRYGDDENAMTTAERKPYGLSHFAYMRKAANERWAYGFGVFAPAGFGAEYDLINTTVDPNRSEYRYKSFGALARILPGVAYQVNDRLSLGATLGVAVSHAEIEGPFFMQTAPFAGTATNFDLQGTGAALAWSLGMQYQATDRLTFGMAYTGQNRFELDGNVMVEIAGLGSSRYDMEADLVWPRSLGGGFSYQFAPARRVSVDVIWFNWSDAFDRLDVRLSDPTNQTFEDMMGSTATDSIALNWKDTISVRTGYEYAVSDSFVVRAGWVYHRNPVPEATLTPFIPATLENTASLGFGHYGQGHALNIAYQFAFGRHQHVDDSAIVGGDFDNSDMHSLAHWVLLTYTKTW